MNNYNLNNTLIVSPSGHLLVWKIIYIFRSGMTRVNTSTTYVLGHSLTSPLFR
jgi:hypothetical protein